MHLYTAKKLGFYVNLEYPSCEQFQQAMAQAANQLQKIQKKAAQQQNKNNLASNPNLGLSGAERPLHQPTKV